MLKTVENGVENMVIIQRTLQYHTKFSQNKHVMTKRFHFVVYNETVFRFKNGPTFFYSFKIKYV